MALKREDCGLRVRGQEIDTHNEGAIALPTQPAPALVEILVARITGISVRLWRVGPSWSVPSRILDDDFAYLPIEGGVALTINGQAQVVRPGQIAWMPVGVAHAATHLPNQQWCTVVAIHAHLRDAGGSALLAGMPRCIGDLHQAQAWAERLLSAGTVEHGGPEFLAATLRVLLAEQAMSGLVLRPASERGDPRLAPAFAALHGEPSTVHSISDLAARCGLGVVRFRQLFHAGANCAPKAYLDALRLARARSLLSSTTDPVASIARACGFPTPRHFLARFRAVTGMTPSEWRQRGTELMP